MAALWQGLRPAVPANRECVVTVPATIARIHDRLSRGEHAAAYADVLQLLRDRPVQANLADLLVNVALVSERYDEALRVLRSVREHVHPLLFTRCEAALCLLAGDLETARAGAQALMHRADGADAGLSLLAAVAQREGDPEAQLRWMLQRERRLAQVPVAILFERWRVQSLLGQQEQILAQTTHLLSVLPATHAPARKIVLLQQAMALHDQLQFADSTASALALARQLATERPAGPQNMPVTARISTHRRQSLILADIERLVLTTGLPVVIHAGTLLGLVRNGDLLPGDLDVDVAVVPPATSAQVAQALIATGAFKAQSHSVDSGSFRALLHLPTGLTVDVSEYTHEGAWFITRWRHPSGVVLREAAVPAFAPVLVDHPAIGRRLPQPDDPAPLLAATYGDWRTPNSAFDTMVSAPNLLGFTDFLRSVAAIRLADTLLAGDMAMARHLAGRLADHGSAGDIVALLSEHRP
jgi:hypothetical protein